MVDFSNSHAGTLEKVKTEIVKDQSLYHHRSTTDDKNIKPGEVAGNPFQSFYSVIIPLVRFLNPKENHENCKDKSNPCSHESNPNGRPDTCKKHVFPLQAHINHG